jgi:hypothetical protein
MNALPKPAPALRSADWLQYVRSLPCVVTGRHGCVAHHIVGGRYSTLKTSDFLAIPLADAEHKLLHDHGWRTWELAHGDQLHYSLRTLEQGIRDGVLCWAVKQPADLEFSARDLEQAIRDGALVLDRRAAKYIAG